MRSTQTLVNEMVVPFKLSNMRECPGRSFVYTSLFFFSFPSFVLVGILGVSGLFFGVIFASSVRGVFIVSFRSIFQPLELQSYNFVTNWAKRNESLMSARLSLNNLNVFIRNHRWSASLVPLFVVFYAWPMLWPFDPAKVIHLSS